jgi:hypothetical protein
LRRIRLFASQIVVVGILAAAGVVTAGALAGGGGPQNTTTKNGTGGGAHNTGGGETTPTPETTQAPTPSTSTQKPSAPVDPTKTVTTTNLDKDPAKARAKENAREESQGITPVMAMMCSFALLLDLGATGGSDPFASLVAEYYRFVCIEAITQVFELNAILRADPPDANFAEVAFPAQTSSPSVRVICPKRLTPRTCARVSAGALAYERALAATSAAALGLVSSLNRFGSATAAGSADARLLQAGAAKAYVGELANALNAQHRAGRALAALLRAMRLDARLNPQARVAVAKKLASPGGLPTWLLRATVSSGVVANASALRTALATALLGVPKALSVGSALTAGSPAAGLTQFQHSLTVYELAAVVRALGKQGAIAQGTSETLLDDLRAALTATTPAARAALALFAQHASVAQPAPAALLTSAARALS